MAIELPDSRTDDTTATTVAAVDPATRGDSDDVDPDLARLRFVLLRVARSIRTNSLGDVTPSQLAVLATVSRHGPCTVGQIAQRERVRPPSASKIVAALEDRGLVERRADPVDRRCAHIAVTPAGDAYLEGVRAAGATWLAERLADIGPDQRQVVMEAVDALEALLGADQ